MKTNKKRIIIFAVIAAVIANVIIFFNIKPASVNYGTSEIYSLEDRKEAVELIEKEIQSWDGCKLYNISYTSDDLCKSELSYCNSTADEGTVYSRCIIFKTLFRSPVTGGGAWRANSVYAWEWILARTEKGNWEIITFGEG